MTPSAWEALENAHNAVRAFGQALMGAQSGTQSGMSPDQERLLIALDAIVQCLAAAIKEANFDLLAQQAATIASLEKKFRILAEHSDADFQQ
jgi:hypothetical protein